MSDIWAACGSRAQAVELAGEVLRMVESQEQVATQRLVGNLAEQDLPSPARGRNQPARRTPRRSTTCWRPVSLSAPAARFAIRTAT
jgi:hypothetical protein